MDPREQLTGVLSTGAGGPLAARLIGVAELVDPAVAGHPSVITRAPGSTCSVTKECSEAADPSVKTAIRARPNPRGSLTSTATPTIVFLPFARPPRNPGSSPPMYVSSTSTVPVNRSRPGRTRTERSRCSIAHAVGYEPISSDRCRLNATCRPCPRRTSSRPRTTRQRRPAAVEHRPRRDRRAAPAGRAPVTAVGSSPP